MLKFSKLRCALLLLLALLSLPVQAQVTGDQYSADDLEKLVEPVALYPDTLLTHVLTAASEPTQVQSAYQLTQSGGSAPSDFEPAVTALMEFPDVLAMMVQNTDWTAALGYAVDTQPDDVMLAVQQVRSKVQAAGNLNSSSQMTVEDTGGVIVINSPDDNTVYVPSYDEDDMYTPGAALLTFGAAVAVNQLFWSGACNWNHGFYYGSPGAYRNWHYGTTLPAGGRVWGARPAPYAGRAYNRPAVNSVNVNQINVNNARTNVRVGNNNANVRVNNTVRANNAVRPSSSGMPQFNNGAGNFQYQRGVDARAGASRGRQSIGARGGGMRGGGRR